ncbi:MAG: YigZ family protein [Clostridia bacterium]|nr:YigZ family protein [Clostridia bacterium]
MQKDWFYSVDRSFENVIVISKSRFITTLLPISGYDDALEKIKAISKRYSDATHNCYAFISNESMTEQRFSDDGEPQGTAGMPMLEVLRKRKVCMTLVVVTRYFGGVKLGANGLVGAYSSSVAQALDNAKLLKNEWAEIVKICVDYGAYKKIEEICVRADGQVVDVAYDKDVALTVALPSQNSKEVFEKIVDFTQNNAKIDTIESRYFQFEI